MQKDIELSWCRLRRHRRHRRLSLWQPMVPPATTRPAPWQHSVLVRRTFRKKGSRELHHADNMQWYINLFDIRTVSSCGHVHHDIELIQREESQLWSNCETTKRLPIPCPYGELWGTFSDFWKKVCHEILMVHYVLQQNLWWIQWLMSIK